MKSIASLITGALLCTGCAPLPITVASLVADGMSYAATDKSLTDHGLSALSAQDCAIHRLLTEGVICRETEGEIVVATTDLQTQSLSAAPQPVATPAGNVTVTHFGSIGEPIPGVYMVLASSRNLSAARTFSTRNPAMTSQVFAMPAGGRRVMYHVITGPVTQRDYIVARKKAAQLGFSNTWALKINESDWRRADELKQQAELHLSAQLRKNIAF